MRLLEMIRRTITQQASAGPPMRVLKGAGIVLACILAFVAIPFEPVKRT